MNIERIFKRIINIGIFLVKVSGLFLFFALAKAFLPDWAYILIVVVMILALSWMVSKTEEDGIHYFIYHIMKKDGSVIIGSAKLNSKTFSLTEKELAEEIDGSILLSATEIDERTFIILDAQINKMKNDRTDNV